MKKVLGWVKSKLPKIPKVEDLQDKVLQAYKEARPKVMVWSLHKGTQFQGKLEKYLSNLQTELYCMGAEGADAHGYSLEELWGQNLVPNARQWDQISSHAHWDQGKHVYQGTSSYLYSRGGKLPVSGFVGGVKEIRQKAYDLGQEFAEGYREYRAEKLRVREKKILARYAQGILEELQRRKDEGDELSQSVLVTLFGAGLQDFEEKAEDLWSGVDESETQIRREWTEIFRQRRAEQRAEEEAELAEEPQKSAPEIAKVTTSEGDVSYVVSDTPPQSKEVSQEELSDQDIAEIHGNHPEILEALRGVQKEERPDPEDESEPDSESED